MIGPVQKVLITSLGSIGRRHLTNLRALLPEATIGALRLTAGSLPQGAAPDRSFETLADALAFEPDAAIIASPASEHLRLATELVGRGVPVLVEKPFAVTGEGLGAVVALAEARSVPLRIAYNLRYHPLLRHVRQLVQAEAIGRVISVRAEVGQYLPDWRPQSRYQDGVSANPALGGGALLELSHELDYLYWMFGRPGRVFAAGGTLGDLNIAVEDIASLTMTYDAPERLISVHLDFLQRAVSRTCKLIGTQGTIVADIVSGRLDLYNAASKSWMTQHHSPLDPNQTYRDEIAAFLASLSGSQCDLPSGSEGLDVMGIIDAARRSMSSRQLEEVR
ncbi:Gfo/Idh/MocA family protein [Devosia sp. XGJD_8]|uniref:Gfo/Idh/MocA family protein n=1 Tax=Devosia sp. XGJD_8 TaxID=3391187 RepID=UPI003984DBEE